MTYWIRWHIVCVKASTAWTIYWLVSLATFAAADVLTRRVVLMERTKLGGFKLLAILPIAAYHSQSLLVHANNDLIVAMDSVSEHKIVLISIDSCMCG